MRKPFITRTGLALALLAAVFQGCGLRAPHAPVAAASNAISLEESKALEVITIWRKDLTDTLNQEEGDWPTQLSRLRDVQTRRGLRPGRICFSTLAAGGDPDRADALDVTGLLLGQQSVGDLRWFLFIVGVVQRVDFRPVEIRDVRLTAFATGGSDPLWRQGEADAQSLERYKETYRKNIPIRFPADDDSYQVSVVGHQVTVRELRSGAEWTLMLTGNR